MKKALPRLLGVKQVAEIFGVTSKTIWMWTELGKLPYVQIPGGRRRYDQRDITTFIEQNKNRKSYNIF